MQGVGSHLRSAEGVHQPVIIADDVPRNIDSAHALARGLGLPTQAVAINGSAFFRCNPPSKKRESALIATKLATARPPPNASRLVAKIDRLLGGKTKIGNQRDEIKDGKLKGRIELASMAAETFLMQYGAGLPVAWGELKPAEMYQLQQMHVYEWSIDRSAKPIEQAKSSRMLSAIVEALGEPGNTTTIFVGHDTDLNGLAVLLELGWRALPYPDNTTAPNVALRFRTQTEGRVAVDVVYTTYESTDGVLLSMPVLESTASGFCQRVVHGIDQSCAPLPTRGLCESEFVAHQPNNRISVKTDDIEGNSDGSWLRALVRLFGIDVVATEREREEHHAPAGNHRGDEDDEYEHDGAWSHDWHEEHEEL